MSCKRGNTQKRHPSDPTSSAHLPAGRREEQDACGAQGGARCVRGAGRSKTRGGARGRKGWYTLVVIDQRTYRTRTKPTEQAKIRAKALRDEMTAPEKLLWSALRNNQVSGLSFRSQHPIGVYIADFYCPKARLVVEVDGSVHHGDQLAHDHKRDQWMQSCGIHILRVQARAVFMSWMWSYERSKPSRFNESPNSNHT